MRVLARPLLASWFVFKGVSDALEPAPRARELEAALEPLGLAEGDVVPSEVLIRVHGAATALTAAVLGLSRSPRAAGAALTGLAAITVATSAPFWRLPEGPERDAALERFVMNLSLLGGAALASTAGHSERHIKRVKARKERQAAEAKAMKAAAKAARKRA